MPATGMESLSLPEKWETPYRAGIVGVHGRVTGHVAGEGRQTALENDLQKHRDVLGRGFPSLCLCDP